MLYPSEATLRSQARVGWSKNLQKVATGEFQKKSYWNWILTTEFGGVKTQTQFHRCEWGHDDYSLKGENLPQAPPDSHRWAPAASQ
jgi:hypothetical protein